MSDTVNRRKSTSAAGGVARIGRRAARAATGAIMLTLAFSVGLPAAFLDMPFVGTALADPPPWAPAHGYRAKGKHKFKRKGKHRRSYSQTQAYRVPVVGIPSGICNREVIGAIIGGAAGGYAGSRFGSGKGNMAATAAGALLGLLVGGSIGRSMDQVDQDCIGQTLEQAEDRRSVRWRNPDSGTDYRITPTKTYSVSDGRYCREYTTEATVGGKTQRTYGTACRQPDGSWKLGS
jgi:surface antigen